MKYLLSGFNTRAAAESGVKSGYEIVSLDCFGDVDHGLCCRLEEYVDNNNAPYQETLFKQIGRLLRQEHFNGIICESGFENRPDLVKKLYRFGVPVLGNQPVAISRLRNFPKLSRKLVAAGFQAPLTFAGGEAVYLKGKNTVEQRRWLKKPIQSGGGWGIDFVRDGTRIAADFALQEYIGGLPCSFAFLASGSRSMLLGVAEQLIGTAKENQRLFGYRGNIFPLMLPVRADQERVCHAAAGIAHWLTTTYGLIGLHGVDFIHDGEKCWVVEVNPRYSASMELMELAGGLPMLKLHIEACQGIMPREDKDALAAWSADTACYGKLILYADRDLEIMGHDAGVAEWIWALRRLGIRDISKPGTFIPRGAPLVTLIASGKDRSACLHKLDQQAQDVLLNRTPLKIKRFVQ